MRISTLWASIVLSAFGLLSFMAFPANAAPTWSIEEDFAGTSLPTSQARSLRGLALSNDDQKLYGGFIQGGSSAAIRKVSVGGGVDVSTPIGATNRQPKAIATDDRGNVFASATIDGTDGVFRVYDSNLGSFTSFTPAGTMRIGGMSVYKTGTDYFLYVAREASSSAFIERYNVTNTAGITLDASFNVRSFFPTAAELTGLEVDGDGTIYATDRDLNIVFKVSSDFSTFSSVTVNRAMDVALFGDNLYVSRYAGTGSDITVLRKSDLAFVETLSTGIARANAAEGYSGIDISADGRIYVADQIYQQTTVSGTTTLRDRILVSSPLPEPGCIGVLALASLGLLRRRTA